ncbi:hypothetical protein E3N88_38601 [Mikania micrantha]|uniref:Uncharacterized protein n=1 Tax=Mikania micrantha TaxID=192012 RepID=A0A5N6LUG2_9ASTR|nr:hypothetical protein E3N88_38601 [Mikania micrantha]
MNAPMSMTKIASVAKQRRVNAPNVMDKAKEIFNKNLANHTCIKHRSDKHLILVDEDEDENEDDDIFQDYVDQDDEYEEIDQIASANIDDEIPGDNEHDTRLGR